MQKIMIGIVVFVVLALLIYILKTYNDLVTLRNKGRNQKSQIDIELKRRFDLVPNLVEVVKGYAKHEKTALEDVINARNNYTSVVDNTGLALEADGNLSSSLTHLFALSEAYPDLKANTSFLSLQKSLSEIEQKIVYARQFYNDSVYKLNNKIELFPSNIIASTFNFRKESFFEAKEEEKENVTTNFE